MRTLHEFVNAAVELLLRYVPSRRGNDGLSALERRLHVLQYSTTVGYRPPSTTDHLQRLDILADKSPGPAWRRPVHSKTG